MNRYSSVILLEGVEDCDCGEEKKPLIVFLRTNTRNGGTDHLFCMDPMELKDLLLLVNHTAEALELHCERT